MKPSIFLRPTLEELERRHLGISDALIEAVERGETSAAIAASVRQSPEWAEYQETKSAAAAESVPQEQAEPLPMPAHLKDLIRQRVAVLPLAAEKIPVPGQIVRVTKIVTPKAGELDAVLTAPLHVLLDAPAEEKTLWHGWLVAGETDYASWWDAVLQEDEARFDPEAGMVQLWNPVQLYLPMADRVVGLLPPAALQTVRALAAEFVSTDAPTDIAPWPGRVAMRSTLGGLQVVTGSPLGGKNDPRHRYQSIYFDAAEAVREPARLALRALATVPQGVRGSFLRQLMGSAARQLAQLWPQPQVAVAMRDSTSTESGEEVPDLLWPDLARLRLEDYDAKCYGRMEVSAIGQQAITVQVMRGELVEESHSLPPGQKVLLSWDEGSTALVLSAADGQTLRLELNPRP